MPEKIWEKYEKLKEIGDKNSNVKTYLARIETFVKEIKTKDKHDYIRISQRLEQIKNKIKIYDILEENDIIYIVLENKEDLNAQFDELLFSEKLNVVKEGITKGHGAPIKKNEIFELFEMEKSICKIEGKNKNGDKTSGSGFFCKLNDNMISFKYALFTNNHVLDESSFDIGKTIQLEYLEKSFFNSYNLNKKEIIMTDERRVYTNEELDYTCIELLESDDIIDFFEIEPDLFKYDNKEILKDNEIFILQFPGGNNLSFSLGKILTLKDNTIVHTASTEGGSSGSPIIRRNSKNYVIGLHFGCHKEDIYNLATDFISIVDDIRKQEISEINCIYFSNENEIFLLHDYSEYITGYNKNKYLEAKKNKNLFEKNMELYINERKISFSFKYKMEDLKEIKVKFKFNKNLIKSTSFMFRGCSSLKSVDLSKFNTRNVKDMSYMFDFCSSLKSIDLSSCNTSNVKDMSGMFRGCSSIKSIDLSSFNTSNVINMELMFHECRSLKSIDLSSFNTSNVTNMRSIFNGCTGLNSIDLSSFNTSNVKDMARMFYRCCCLESIDLSTFNTSNVKGMEHMFAYCSSLEYLNISLFNTSNVKDMKGMFYYSLSKDNIKINNNKDKIIKDFEELTKW